MSREQLQIGDEVVASLKSKVPGIIRASNQFNEVLVEWEDKKTYWVNRRHLLLKVAVDLLQSEASK